MQGPVTGQLAPEKGPGCALAAPEALFMGPAVTVPARCRVPRSFEGGRWPPRPRVSSGFYKAHGLGNDYLVFEGGDDLARDAPSWTATPENVERVCDPHRGVGADGVVVLDSGSPRVHAGRISVSLRMFNPDGGEFERSGNGLRVLASYLLKRHPGIEIIDAVIAGSRVRMRVHGSRAGTFDISVDMGTALTGAAAIDAAPELLAGAQPPFVMAGPQGEPLHVVPVSVGNPHLVVLAEPSGMTCSEAVLRPLGTFLSSHPSIRHGTNVQLARAVDGRAEACIWERGVGRTSASGTSSCAVAVALVLAGHLAPGTILVEMPGGRMQVTVDESYGVQLRGPVVSVLSGTLEPGLLATFVHDS